MFRGLGRGGTKPLHEAPLWLVTSSPSSSSRSHLVPCRALATAADTHHAIEDPRTARLRQAMLEKGLAEMAKLAFEQLGHYAGNEVAWRSFILPVRDEVAKQKEGKTTVFSNLSLADFTEFVKVLVKEVQLTQASFWEAITSAAVGSGTLPQRGTTITIELIKELLKLATLYAQIGAWELGVFGALYGAVQREKAVHTLDPASLFQLIHVFSRVPFKLSRLAGQILDETIERVQVELEERQFSEVSGKPLDQDPARLDFRKVSIEDCLDLLESISIFAPGVKKYQTSHVPEGSAWAQEKGEPFLRQIARDRLHKDKCYLTEFTGQQAARLCDAYGALSWRHDTVFKDIIMDIQEEQVQLMRSRVLGEAGEIERRAADSPRDSAGSPSTDSGLKYKSHELALICLAMLRMKNFRGDTEWFKWGQNYKELVQLLQRRLEVENELEDMSAKTLAATAYVLGRSRMGTDDLLKAMWNRMMKLLEFGTSRQEHSVWPDPPQQHLPMFLDGLVNMGSQRPKALDAQWFMEWVCKNLWTMEVPDIIRVNRFLTELEIHDREYLQLFVPFFSEEQVMSTLTKDDVVALTVTYNKAKIREEDVGRHFFWALGRRFQAEHVNRFSGEANKRAALLRIG